MRAGMRAGRGGVPRHLRREARAQRRPARPGSDRPGPPEAGNPLQNSGKGEQAGAEGGRWGGPAASRGAAGAWHGRGRGCGTVPALVSWPCHGLVLRPGFLSSRRCGRALNRRAQGRCCRGREGQPGNLDGEIRAREEKMQGKGRRSTGKNTSRRSRTRRCELAGIRSVQGPVHGPAADLTDRRALGSGTQNRRQSIGTRRKWRRQPPPPPQEPGGRVAGRQGRITSRASRSGTGPRRRRRRTRRRRDKIASPRRAPPRRPRGTGARGGGRPPAWRTARRSRLAGPGVSMCRAGWDGRERGTDCRGGRLGLRWAGQ